MTRSSAWILASALMVALPTAVVAADRSKPPEPGPARPLTLPRVERRVLANGLRLVVARIPEVPVVDATLLVGAGATQDPPERLGLASMMADMLDEGAGERSTIDLAEALEFLGAELTTDASWEAMTVRLHVPRARWQEALPLLADVARRPKFQEHELARLRKEALTDILQARDVPGRVASAAVAQAVFGRENRYGRPLGGDVPSLTALSVSDLRGLHTRLFVPSNATLILVGDLDDEAEKAAEGAFGDWRGDSGATTAATLPRRPPARRIIIVDRPAAPQSTIRIGAIGPPRRTPDYAALEVANTLLGGSFSSRLNQNLRERHGYTYGARSGFDYRRALGQFVAGADVATAVTGPALQEFIKELGRIRTLAGGAEVARARSYLALGLPGEFETTRQIASKLAEISLFGLPEDEFASLVQKALAVGPAELRRVASAHIDPARASIVVVGDRAVIEGPIRRLGLGPVEVRSVDEVMGPPPTATQLE